MFTSVTSLRSHTSPNDGFVALGGSSLLATRVASGVCDVFGVEVSVTDIFECTVAEMERRLDKQGRARNIDITQIANVYREISKLSDEEVHSLLSEEGGTK